MECTDLTHRTIICPNQRDVLRHEFHYRMHHTSYHLTSTTPLNSYITKWTIWAITTGFCEHCLKEICPNERNALQDHLLPDTLYIWQFTSLRCFEFIYGSFTSHQHLLLDSIPASQKYTPREEVCSTSSLKNRDIVALMYHPKIRYFKYVSRYSSYLTPSIDHRREV
jgi:hypothetical protein